jgi:hypothetical protein
MVDPRIQKAFVAELEKTALLAPQPFQIAHPKQRVFNILMGALAGAVGAPLGAYIGMGKKKRKRLRAELRDPRLASNVKGMLTLKSREKRLAAHAALRKKYPKSRFVD